VQGPIIQEQSNGDEVNTMPRYFCPANLILLLIAVFSLTLTSVKLVASPPPPIVRASSSTNGRFLVLIELEYDNPDPHAVRRIVWTTYRVTEAEDSINGKDRLPAPAPLWSESALTWQVTSQGNDGIFWPLISNDGQSLILVGVTAAVPGGTVLKIYRKNMFEGSLVRSFQITDLWTANEVDPGGKGIFIVTDATPEWFAGGSLAFSLDDQTLIYCTPWNDLLSIRLVDGVISRKRPRA
jgi:hypothetical protein